jgi:pyruvate formate lyase activating enzyme
VISFQLIFFANFAVVFFFEQMKEMSTNPKIISKREFIRQCAICTGGLALGAYRPNWFSNPSNSDLEKWSKEALFYTKTADGLQCNKCPQGCLLLNDGDVGFCRNRVANNGKIYTIAYGNPCAVHIDPIERSEEHTSELQSHPE